MGNCVSAPKKTKQDAGISSTEYLQTTNKKTVNRFHENDNVINGSPTNNNKARKAKVIKKQKKKIHKGLIGLPSNFQHTGHVGITELRSGKVDPEKIKSQMAEVAAALNLVDLNIGGLSVPPTNPTNNVNNANNDINDQEDTLLSMHSENNSINDSRPTSFQSDSQFKIKRKPTLSQISSPVQNSRPSSPSSLNPILDPMAEIVAALKMPIDGNFDNQNGQKLVV